MYQFNIYIETLSEARFKAKRAELTSDLSDDDGGKRNKRKKISLECPIYSGVFCFYLISKLYTFVGT